MGSEYTFTIDKGCYLFESIVINYERGISEGYLNHPVSSFDFTGLRAGHEISIITQAGDGIRYKNAPDKAKEETAVSL